MSKVLHFSDESFAAEVEGSEVPVLVDFTADWCAPCRMMAPIVEQVAEEYDSRAGVGKLNVDESQATAMRFGIQGIPTLLFFKGGKPADRIVGMAPKEELCKRLDRLLEQK